MIQTAESGDGIGDVHPASGTEFASLEQNSYFKST